MTKFLFSGTGTPMIFAHNLHRFLSLIGNVKPDVFLNFLMSCRQTQHLLACFDELDTFNLLGDCRSFFMRNLLVIVLPRRRRAIVRVCSGDMYDIDRRNQLKFDTIIVLIMLCSLKKILKRHTMLFAAHSGLL